MFISLKVHGEMMHTSVDLMSTLENFSQGGSVGNLLSRAPEGQVLMLNGTFELSSRLYCVIQSKPGIQVIPITPLLASAGFYSHIHYAFEVSDLSP